ncbi:MAG: GNAT family N-acetyltransferase [Lachnospiraceae bacterium]|nr:GNAT family N-acetyltransferase [Lachnospiraceae bacterium]
MTPAIHQTSCLTTDQQQALLSLVRLCQKHDSLSLSYPIHTEDGASAHYLLSDSRDRLLSALALLPLDDATCECIAFTHPAHRQKGYFSRLLALALESCPECDLLFPVSGTCTDTLAALDTLGAELSHQELRMERKLSLPLPYMPSIQNHHVELLTPESVFSENAVWQLFLSSPANIIGSCLTSLVSPEVLCLHQVEITSRLRGQGFGLALLCLLLSHLQQKDDLKRILLHVSADNIPAVSLYKKTGFRITETLSYYWY